MKWKTVHRGLMMFRTYKFKNNDVKKRITKIPGYNEYIWFILQRMIAPSIKFVHRRRTIVHDIPKLFEGDTGEVKKVAITGNQNIISGIMFIGSTSKYIRLSIYVEDENTLWIN